MNKTAKEAIVEMYELGVPAEITPILLSKEFTLDELQAAATELKAEIKQTIPEKMDFIVSTLINWDSVPEKVLKMSFALGYLLAELTPQFEKQLDKETYKVVEEIFTHFGEVTDEQE